MMPGRQGPQAKKVFEQSFCWPFDFFPEQQPTSIQFISFSTRFSSIISKKPTVSSSHCHINSSLINLSAEFSTNTITMFPITEITWVPLIADAATSEAATTLKNIAPQMSARPGLEGSWHGASVERPQSAEIILFTANCISKCLDGSVENDVVVEGLNGWVGCVDKGFGQLDQFGIGRRWFPRRSRLWISKAMDVSLMSQFKPMEVDDGED